MWGAEMSQQAQNEESTNRRLAANVILYDFLIDRYPGELRRITYGKRIGLRNDHSVMINAGFKGYIDWATNEGGNAIDFLMNYINRVSYDQAVEELSQWARTHSSLDTDRIMNYLPIEFAEPKSEHVPFPKIDSDRSDTAKAYLMSRGISEELVDGLFASKLVFQTEENGHANIMFKPADEKFCEVRGCITGKKYHRSYGDKSGNYWAFKVGPASVPAKRAYICEGAIDAISLADFRIDLGPALFVAIGGVSNRSAVETLTKNYPQAEIIIATDNDEAGHLFAEHFKQYRRITPALKDWNEDLQQLRQNEAIKTRPAVKKKFRDKKKAFQR